MRTSNRGFTLIELMITVAVVAILATVAYPSYQSAVVKSRRAAAQSALSDIAQRQHQYLLDNRAYAASTSELNVTMPADVSRFYTVTIDAPASTPPAFTVTATPTAAGGQLSDGAMSIDGAGTKTPAAKW